MVRLRFVAGEWNRPGIRASNFRGVTAVLFRFLCLFASLSSVAGHLILRLRVTEIDRVNGGSNYDSPKVGKCIGWTAGVTVIFLRWANASLVISGNNCCSLEVSVCLCPLSLSSVAGQLIFFCIHSTHQNSGWLHIARRKGTNLWWSLSPWLRPVLHNAVLPCTGAS